MILAFYLIILLLQKELKVKGYKNTSNILLATLDINEKLTVYEKNVNEQTKDILE